MHHSPHSCAHSAPRHTTQHRATPPPTFGTTTRSLNGTLPDTIGATSFLTNLYLGSNKLHGTIPLNMTTSSQLTAVDLSNNAWLVGSIPSFR